MENALNKMPCSAMRCHIHIHIQQQADRICTLSHVFANVLHIITFNLASLSLIVCSSSSICRAARICLSIENLSSSKTAHHLQLHHVFLVCLCNVHAFPPSLSMCLSNFPSAYRLHFSILQTISNK